MQCSHNTGLHKCIAKLYPTISSEQVNEDVPWYHPRVGPCDLGPHFHWWATHGNLPSTTSGNPFLGTHYSKGHWTLCFGTNLSVTLDRILPTQNTIKDGTSTFPPSTSPPCPCLFATQYKTCTKRLDSSNLKMKQKKYAASRPCKSIVVSHPCTGREWDVQLPDWLDSPVSSRSTSLLPQGCCSCLRTMVRQCRRFGENFTT